MIDFMRLFLNPGVNISLGTFVTKNGDHFFVSDCGTIPGNSGGVWIPLHVHKNDGMTSHSNCFIGVHTCAIEAGLNRSIRCDSKGFLNEYVKLLKRCPELLKVPEIKKYIQDVKKLHPKFDFSEIEEKNFSSSCSHMTPIVKKVQSWIKSKL